MKELIEAYLESQKQRIIEDIQSLVRIESITGNQEENRKALNFLMEKAAEMGIPCKSTREEDALLAWIGSGEEKVGILVHVDVVKTGDPEKWTYPSFSGHVDDQYIWGRGSLDDKGAAVVSLYALKALLELNIPLRKQIWLIVGSNEEEGEWTDILHFKRDFGVPNYGFSPDGDFPIFNEEHGYVDVELEFLELKREDLINLRSGDSANTIPSKAMIQFRDEPIMEFHGISAHSSTPELGKNAIEILCHDLSFRQDLHFIQFIERFLADDHHGNKLGLNPDDENPKKAEGKTNSVCVPTIIKLTNTGVLLNINIRHKHGITQSEIRNCFDRLAGEYGFSVKLVDYLDPLLVDQTHPALRLMSSVYEEYGYKSEFKLGPGTSYAKSMQNFVSWGPNFPGEINCAHMEDEKVSIQSLMCAVKMYTLFLARCSVNSTFDGVSD